RRSRRSPGTEMLRKDEVDLAPVFLRGGALARPCRRVVELIRHLRRPVAAEVAIEQVALDRLTEARRTARAVHFPARRKHRRAARRHVRTWRLLRWAPLLQRHHVRLRVAGYGRRFGETFGPRARHARLNGPR